MLTHLVEKQKRISSSGILISLFIVTLPLTMFQVGALGSGQRLISVFVCVGSLVILYRSRSILRARGGAIFWIVYALSILLSVVWSTAISSSFIFASGILLMVATFVSMSLLPINSHDAKLIKTSWIIVGVVAAGIFVIFGEQAELGNRTLIRLPSGDSDPNEYVAYFLLPLAFFIDNIFQSRTFIKILSLMASIGILYIIFMTGSRAGAIAALVTVVLIIVRHAQLSVMKFLLACSVLISGLFVSQQLLWPLIPEEVRSRLTVEALVEDNGSGRAEIWNSGLELILNSGWRIVTGFGPNGAPLVHSVMHNHFLQSLVDGGLIGLTLFVAIIVCALRSSGWNTPIFAATVGIVIMFMTLTAYSNFRPAWAVLFMAMVVANEHHMSKKFEEISDRKPTPKLY